MSDSSLKDGILRDGTLTAPRWDQEDEENAGQMGVEEEFDALLVHIKSSRGFDFSGYKRGGLMRRVNKQMESVEVGSYSDYVDYLEVHPNEFERLFDTILINVTSFFRDTGSWDYLREEVVPRLLAAKGPEEPIRLWSAGCASGQEPYSLAMLMTEALGPERFRQQVKIYATDVDEQALAQARAGAYSAREMQSVPDEMRDKYFEREDDTYIFQRDMRRALIFGRHDLMQDAPISRIDLLACRNTIMYFNAEVQARIVNRFHFAVSESSFLFLGKAEMMFTHASLFVPLDLKRRVFQKLPTGGQRERGIFLTPSEDSPVSAEGRLREMLFQEGTVAQIAVDSAGCLAMTNAPARQLFRLNTRDIGRPLQDLEISYRPVELRSCIDRAYAERRPIAVTGVSYSPLLGETLYLDALVTPLLEGGAVLGVGISFADVTRVRQLSDELQAASRELETAYEELQSTNEELETTNEELQSTVEELETTNEELQSTNEELETTNEELQSTNEELQTINEELRMRSMDLDQVNSFLKSILASLRGGVIVLDSEMKVQFWNDKSEDFWGLRADETRGRTLLSLDIGLPATALLPAIQSSLMQPESRHRVVVDALNRRGRPLRCSVEVTPLIDPNTAPNIRGVLLQIEEADKAGEAAGK